MPLHEAWHFLVLASVLLGAAGLGLLAVAGLAWPSPPPALLRARPALVTLAGLGGMLLVGEWLFVH